MLAAAQCSSIATRIPAYQRFIGTMCSVKPSTLKNSTNQSGAGRAAAVAVDQHVRIHHWPSGPFDRSGAFPAAAGRGDLDKIVGQQFGLLGRARPRRHVEVGLVQVFDQRADHLSVGRPCNSGPAAE